MKWGTLTGERESKTQYKCGYPSISSLRITAVRLWKPCAHQTPPTTRPVFLSSPVACLAAQQSQHTPPPRLPLDHRPVEEGQDSLVVKPF